MYYVVRFETVLEFRQLMESHARGSARARRLAVGGNGAGGLTLLVRQAVVVIGPTRWCLEAADFASQLVILRVVETAVFSQVI